MNGPLIGDVIWHGQIGGPAWGNGAALPSGDSVSWWIIWLFDVERRLARTHANVLVFCKGDPEAATAACGPVEAMSDADLVEATFAREGGAV